MRFIFCDLIRKCTCSICNSTLFHLSRYSDAMLPLSNLVLQWFEWFAPKIPESFYSSLFTGKAIENAERATTTCNKFKFIKNASCETTRVNFIDDLKVRPKPYCQLLTRLRNWTWWSRFSTGTKCIQAKKLLRNKLSFLAVKWFTITIAKLSGREIGSEVVPLKTELVLLSVFCACNWFCGLSTLSFSLRSDYRISRYLTR